MPTQNCLNIHKSREESVDMDWMRCSTIHGKDPRVGMIKVVVRYRNPETHAISEVEEYRSPEMIALDAVIGPPEERKIWAPVVMGKCPDCQKPTRHSGRCRPCSAIRRAQKQAEYREAHRAPIIKDSESSGHVYECTWNARHFTVSANCVGRARFRVAETLRSENRFFRYSDIRVVLMDTRERRAA